MRTRKTLYLFLLIIFLFFLWHSVIVLFNFNQTLFPTPFSVAKSLFQSTNLYVDIYSSLIRLILGSVLGISLGVIFGILTGHISSINDSFGKVSNFFRFIPPLALVPLFLIWFGIGEFSKISLLAWTAFFPTWISTHNGIKNVETKYFLVAKSLNFKTSALIKEVLLKGSIGYIINGARIGVGIAFSVLVAAEMLGAYSGLGYRISFLQSVYRVDRMIGYIFILGLMGIFIDKIFLNLLKKYNLQKNEG